MAKNIDHPTSILEIQDRDLSILKYALEYTRKALEAEDATDIVQKGLEGLNRIQTEFEKAYPYHKRNT